FLVCFLKERPLVSFFAILRAAPLGVRTRPFGMKAATGFLKCFNKKETGCFPKKSIFSGEVPPEKVGGFL
ncbi:hypothetical protein, partial [Ralstonia solanacearum]|uniref:hypothetical protein n=1 Tax=Ralstonia solanacearum TaxID=305 RepID=UPI0019D4026E